MAKFKLTGFDSYIAQLQMLADPIYVEKYLGQAIYEGAKVVADNTKKALESLPVDNRPATVDNRKSINTLQKKGLIDSYGIAPSRYDGNFFNVKVGFDGYNSIKTKRWPMGQPNVVIARSLESGTSFMKKNPIISRTENASKDDCINAMQKSLNQTIEKIMK